MNKRHLGPFSLLLVLALPGAALAQEHIAVVCENGVWVDGEPFPPKAENSDIDDEEEQATEEEEEEEEAEDGEEPRDEKAAENLPIGADHFRHYEFQRVPVPDGFVIAIAYSSHDRVKLEHQEDEAFLAMEIRRDHDAEQPHWSSLTAEDADGDPLGVQTNSIFLRPGTDLLENNQLGSPLQESLEEGREVMFRDQAAETVIDFDTGILLEALEQLERRCR